VSGWPVSRVRALSIHADYRCRSAGACCSSGWDIAVDPEAEERIERGLASGRLRVLRRAAPATPSSWRRPVAGGPHPALLHDAGGACVFFDPGSRLCAVQRDDGEEALPSACRQFPRVTTLTPLGVSIALSHYCPTAASTLFRPSSRGAPSESGDEGSAPGGLAIVEGPPAFPSSWPWEGLDAGDALPPLLRPGVLMDWPSLERWERFCVSALAEEGRSAEDALGLLETAAEEARRWTPERGAFGVFFERVLSHRGVASALSSRGAPSELGDEGSAIPVDSSGPVTPKSLGMTVAWELVAESVPHRALLPAAPEGLGEAEDRWVAPAWSSLARPIRRWLAAKAFASWLALQGEGLRTVVLGLRVALGVLRAEATRGCAEAGRALDAALLKEAFRRADLILVHLADPEALARRLSRSEVPAGGS
jgi:Fe-S-cluster containining protein